MKGRNGGEAAPKAGAATAQLPAQCFADETVHAKSAVEQHAEREAAVETCTAVLTEDPWAAAVSTATHPLELLALAEKYHHLLRGSSALTVLDRLSKLLLLAGNGHAGKALREEALSSKAMQLLLGVLTDHCNAVACPEEAVASAWSAVVQLYVSSRAMPPCVLAGLEAALLNCLCSGPGTGIPDRRPSRHTVVRIWMCWSQLAAAGDPYRPCHKGVRRMMWIRTRSLSNTQSFDCSNIASLLWAFGQLQRRLGSIFEQCSDIAHDVLASFTHTVAVHAAEFSVEGLTVAAVGCANMGSAVHKASSELMAVLVAESLKRPTQFGQRAVGEMADALMRMGGLTLLDPNTFCLLAVLYLHAASMQPPTAVDQIEQCLKAATEASQREEALKAAAAAMAAGRRSVTPPPLQYHPMQASGLGQQQSAQQQKSQSQQQLARAPAQGAAMGAATADLAATPVLNGAAGGIGGLSLGGFHASAASQQALLPWNSDELSKLLWRQQPSCISQPAGQQVLQLYADASTIQAQQAQQAQQGQYAPDAELFLQRAQRQAVDELDAATLLQLQLVQQQQAQQQASLSGGWLVSQPSFPQLPAHPARPVAQLLPLPTAADSQAALTAQVVGQLMGGSDLAWSAPAGCQLSQASASTSTPAPFPSQPEPQPSKSSRGARQQTTRERATLQSIMTELERLRCLQLLQ